MLGLFSLKNEFEAKMAVHMTLSHSCDAFFIRFFKFGFTVAQAYINTLSNLFKEIAYEEPICDRRCI